MQKYKVTIPKRGLIPGIGNGPINKPVYISVQKYNQLVKLGFPVNIISNNIDEAKTISTSIPKNETPEVVVEETITNEVVNEETNNDETPEVVVEEVVEEVVVDDINYSADAYYNETFLTTKNICKTILDNRKVSYDTSSSLTKLKSLVMQSNPVIDEE